MRFKDIFSFLKRPIGFKQSGSFPYSAVLNLPSLFGGLGEEKDFDYYDRLGYTCISKIAQGIARSEWDLFKMDDKGIVDIAEDHQLIGLLKNPNPVMTEYDFKELTIILGEIYGRMPWIIIKDSKGIPLEIWPALPPNLSVKKTDEYGYPLLWEYSIGNIKKEYGPDEVIDLKYPSPSNPTEGKAPLSAVKKALDLDKYMTEWNINLMENDARPPLIIKYKETLDDEQKKKLQELFKDQYQGVDKAYRKALVLTGGAEVDSKGFAPKDLEFNPSKLQIRDEILSSFGVSKTILGLEANVPRASMEQAERNFAKYTLEPKLTKITLQLNKKLVPLFDENLWLDFKPLAQEDRDLQLQEFEKGWNKWMTTNEIRKEKGFEPIEGGDYLYIPLNLIPMAKGEKGETKIMKLKSKEPVRVNLKKQSEVRKNILARNILNRQKKEAILKSIEKRLSEKIQENQKKKTKYIISIKKKDKKDIKDILPDVKKKFWEIRMKREGQEENKWRKAFNKIFEKQKEEILNNLKKKKSTKGLIDRVMIDKDKEVKATVKIIEPLYYSSLIDAGDEAADFIGMERIDIENLPGVQKWVSNVAQKYSKEMTETTIEDLSAVLQDGIDAGEGVTDIGNRIEDYFKDIGAYRSDMIARTETARATTEGHSTYWEEMGFEKAEWLLAPDACSICEELSQREWSMKDISSEIPAHPNCKCDLTPK